jgi:predicted regulator of Ras-like GTPase activity (Roadblock/LC7/MglB family)
MEETLRDVCTVAGVRGCFVCDGEGRVIASAPVGRFDQQALEIVGRTLSQTTNGLLMSRRRKIHEIDLLYSDGRLVVKPLAEGCLGVICARTMNVPLLNLTTSVAAKKLAEAMKGEAPQAKAAAPETIELDRATEEIASAYPDLVGPVMHLDQTLAPETREATLTSLGKSVGAAIFRKRYASTRVPRRYPRGSSWWSCPPWLPLL